MTECSDLNYESMSISISRLINRVILIIILISATACTRNDGDIGDLFGRWRLMSLTGDGVSLPVNDESAGVYAYFMYFQGDLTLIQMIMPHESTVSVRGMWNREGDVINLDFSFTGEDGDLYFRPPAALHFVECGVTSLNIDSLSSSDMKLWYIADDGVRYDYRFKKIY